MLTSSSFVSSCFSSGARDKQLKEELDSFDPAFFEEVEDLKYNYHETVKKNVQYEQLLQSLSRQHGFQLPQLSLDS